MTPELKKEAITIKIKVNDSLVELKEEKNITELIHKLVLDGRTGLAVAVNSTVVQKLEWMNFILQENDEVLIIEAAQGG